MSIGHTAGAPDFALFGSDQVTVNGIRYGVVVGGNGTINGTAVRMNVSFVITNLSGPNLPQCSVTDTWNLTLNAAGNSMSGPGSTTWNCPDFSINTRLGVTVTRR
jgi:hypothetical protein